MRFLVLGITCFICLLLLEWLIRFSMPYYNPRLQVVLTNNPDGITIGTPSTTTRQGTLKGDFMTTVRFNDYGFRDAKVFTGGATNDIFVAGDSFSMGWGVEEEERYSNLLEKQLATRFYNLSIPEDIRGYDRTLQFAQRHGANIRHVIIGLCMENDLWDYTVTESTHVRYRREMLPSRARRVAIWFKGNSALWTCLSMTLQKQPSMRRWLEKIGIARNIDDLTHKNLPTPEVLASSRDALLHLATNYHSIVLVIPSRALWYGKNIENEKQVHEQFTGMLTKAGLAIVDMKPIFEREGNPLSYYFQSDPHWNRRGHAAAATALGKYLAGSEDWKQLVGDGKNAAKLSR